MTDTPGLSIAYLLGVDAIAKSIGTTPLPKGLTTVRVGDWTLTINNGREALKHNGHEIGPWELSGRHEVYLAFLMMLPIGGMVGGCSESAFIADMRAAGATVAGEDE